MWRMWTAALWLASLAVAAVKLDPEDDSIKSISLRTHSLSPPYLDSDMQSRWYEYGGDTIIRTDQYIRLTSDKQSRTGWLYSRVPLTATNWEIEVEFKIHGKSQLFGDGFAMWVTKDRGETGPVFGGKDNFEGLGIFFDTYKNNRPGVVFPMVMAMVGDGKTSYDKDNDGKASELTGCSARGIRQATVPTKARVTYFQDKFLKVELQYKSDNEWTECFNVENPPTLPKVTYLGFTAETGELSDNHDIISIQAKNLYTTTPPGGRTPGGFKAAPRPFPKKKKGSWTWFFTKIILVILALGGSYVGYTAWRSSQKRSHRF